MSLPSEALARYIETGETPDEFDSRLQGAAWLAQFEDRDQ